MKVDHFGRVFVAFAFVAAFLGAASVLARTDDAPPPAPPVGPPAPVEPADPFAAFTKKKPIPAPAWRDVAIVERRFAEAVEAVETACGVKFETRPTVRISTREEIKKILRAEFAELPKSLGFEDLAPLMFDAIVGAVTAKYDLAAHVVHVVPESVEQCSAFAGVDLGTENVLRVALAHECTHALDFKRFGWAESRKRISADLEFKALGAIVEGHAQFVAKRVAATWELSREFDLFTKAIGAVPEDAPEFLRSMLQAAVSEVTFGYWEGAAFFEAVAEGAGDEGVLRALEHPPKTTREIEHPAEWLHPEQAATGLDLTPVLSALEALVPSPTWSPKKVDLLEGTIKGQFADQPAEDVKAAFDGFRDAKGFVANRVSSTEMFVVLGMRFSTEAQAKAFTVLDRRMIESKDAKMKTGFVQVKTAEYVDGAGTGGTWSGCTVRKTLAVGPMTMPVSSSIFAAGVFAFEVAVSGRDVERAWMDRVVDALAAYVTDAAHPLPKMPAEAVLQAPPGELGGIDLDHRKSVPMTLVGPDGKSVPRARVAVRYQLAESRFAELELSFTDGATEMPQDARTAMLLFYGATDEAGEPLELGPLYVADVDLDGSDLKFKLPVGRTVEGRVVDASGQGVEGAKVRAQDVESHGTGPGHGSRTVISRAKTDAGGRYRLTGLGVRTQIDFDPPTPLVGPNPIVFEGSGTAPDVAVGEGASAVVTVVDADGKPVAGAFVSWARLAHPEGSTVYDWRRERVRTDASGRATLAEVPRGGELGLSVNPPDGDERFGSFNDSHWNGRDIEVNLASVRRIRGRVVDRTGKPASDASVHLKAPSGLRMTRSVATDGTFAFDGVESGAVYVGATRGGRHEANVPGDEPEPPRWIEVVPGSPVEIVLADAPVTVAVTIRELAAGRTVYVRTGGVESTTRELKSAAGGVVRVPGVVVGSRFDVYVAPTADDPRGLSASGVDSSAEGITLDLVACVPTKGTLRAPTKYKYLETSVILPWGGIPVEVAEDGTFALPPLPPGKYTLRAKARGTDAWIYARIEFEPGAVLDLELHPK